MNGLCKELSRKLAKDLGITPLSFGKTSLTHPDLRIDSSIFVEDEDGVVKDIPLWYGEVAGDGITCCLLAGLDTNPDSLEFVAVIGFKDLSGEFQSDGTRISFHYDWANDEDPGIVMVKAGDKWLSVSLAQRLQLALGFEIMVQDGIIWSKSLNVPIELMKDLEYQIELD
jgi:hypothetical protein